MFKIFLQRSLESIKRHSRDRNRLRLGSHGYKASNKHEKHRDNSIEYDASNPIPERKTPSDRRRLAINIMTGGGVNFLKIAIQLIMLPLMAHLLGPSEFGVYALALPTVVFFTTIADGGLGVSLAREEGEADDLWSTSFWLMIFVGLILGLVIACWGLILASVSQEPRLVAVMMLLSSSFVLVTSSVVPAARLTRDRRLAVISGADLAGNITGAIVAVSLAFNGAGASSLAAQYVSIYLVRTCILNFVVSIRPRFVFKPSLLIEHISTGSSVVSGRLAEFSGRLIENLLLNYFFGTAMLGAFTFANQVSRFICEAASSPIWAALYAHALRDSDQSIVQLHKKLVHILAILVAPVALIGSAAAPSIITLFLGSKWQEAAIILSIVIPFYALNSIASQSGALLLARGAGWLLFALTLVLAVSRIAAIATGFTLSLTGVAWAINISQIIFFLLMLVAPTKVGLSSPRAMFQELLAPCCSGLFAGLSCHIILILCPNNAAIIFVGIFVGGFTYTLSLFLLEGKRLRQDLVEIKSLIRG